MWMKGQGDHSIKTRCNGDNDSASAIEKIKTEGSNNFMSCTNDPYKIWILPFCWGLILQQGLDTSHLSNGIHPDDWFPSSTSFKYSGLREDRLQIISNFPSKDSVFPLILKAKRKSCLVEYWNILDYHQSFGVLLYQGNLSAGRRCIYCWL